MYLKKSFNRRKRKAENREKLFQQNEIKVFEDWKVLQEMPYKRKE